MREVSAERWTVPQSGSKAKIPSMSLDSFLLPSHLCWNLPLLHPGTRPLTEMKRGSFLGPVLFSSLSLPSPVSHFPPCCFSSSGNLLFKLISFFLCRWLFAIQTHGACNKPSATGSLRSLKGKMRTSVKVISESLIIFILICIFKVQMELFSLSSKFNFIPSCCHHK